MIPKTIVSRTGLWGTFPYNDSRGGFTLVFLQAASKNRLCGLS